MPNDTSKAIVVFHSGLKFSFTRDAAGDGYWYCLSPKRSVFGFGQGCVVPRQYWSEIRASAAEQGFDRSLFLPIVSNNTAETEPKSIKIYSEEKPRQSAKNDGAIKIF